MRLVVSGYYGFGNAGDDAVLAGMLELLQHAGVDRGDVSVLSADPAETSHAHDVRAVSRWNPLRIASELRRAEGLISGGGGLLQDVSSVRPVSYYAGVMELAQLVRRPYALVAQGLGPLRREPNRRIARAALQRAAHVSLRDDRSIALARRIGVERAISRTADAALAALSSPSTMVDRRGGHVLVAVRGGYPADAVVGPLRHAVADLSAQRRVVALPMHGAVDRDASTALVAGIAGASVADPDGSLGEKLEAIATASVVIGVRLHALVLAAAAGVPAIAISYDPKVDAFAQRAGIPVIGSVASALDTEQLLSAVDEALRGGGSAYGQRVADMRAEAEADVRTALAAMGHTR
ncbi:MAG TPA: polysaccharide pyruvyl transferase CsaB [Candidatus Limnocylindria bacterium]|nr:polysaccharide pyruvyl transferase CsaB [Candidatus Limnocylindria bacterium]